MAKKTAKSNLRGLYMVLGLVALVGLGIIGYVLLSGGDAATEPVEVADVEDAEALVARATGVALGQDDAPIRIIEFGDYQCPACGQFARAIKPRLQPYLESGQVQYVYYDFPLAQHEHSFLAARAARCAGVQDQFWPYHDLLYGQQSRWMYENNPIGQFIDYAEQLGLDAGAFESCLRSDRFADVVSANLLLGEQIGVSATPWVVVNGRRVPNALDFRAIQAVIGEPAGS